MADVIYKKGQSSNLDNVQIKEGQILVTEDTGEMYVDVTDNDRKKINGMSNSKLGSTILIDDISPVTHEMSVKISSDTVEDLTAVKVTRRGKNLIQTNIIEVTSPAGVENLIWQGHISGKLFFSSDNSEYTPNPSNVNSANFKFVFGDGTVKYLAAHAPDIYLNTSSPLKEIYFLNWGKGTGVIKNIQLEIGSFKTDYEPYVEPTEYTPNADGIVNGVTSIYPNTIILITDTEDVLINCEYLTKLYTEVFDSANIKNGFAVGSLRGIGAKEEDSSYTLGQYSVAEGYDTEASGDYSHAEGFSTTASGYASHVQGKYNISNTTYADVIGNGTSITNTSNAYTMDWNGNAWFAGDVYTKSTSGKNKDEGSKKLATEEYVDTQIISNTDQTYSPTSENAQSGKAVKEAINTAAAIIPGEGTNSIKQNCPFNWASGKASVSIGSNVKTYGDSSIGIGRDLNVRNAYDGNINIDGSNGVNIGYMSTLYNQDGVSLGRENKNYSYVGITAGFNNIAGRPEYADKQFGDDKARGAIAAGWENHAIHAYACVLGDHNNSSRNSQTVFGSYCADDPDALFILGNGTSADNRSNSCTIDKDGNACFTGNVYVGSSKKDGGKRLATIEEGTWPITLFNVPFVGETSVIQPTYTIEYTYCHYFAIDNLVYVNCDTKFIVTNAGRGYACIGGLPFISQNKVSFSVGEVYGCIEGGDGIGYTDGNESRRIRMESNTSQAAIYTGSGASALSFKSGYDSGGKYENCLWIKFSGTYIRG